MTRAIRSVRQAALVALATTALLAGAPSLAASGSGGGGGGNATAGTAADGELLVKLTSGDALAPLLVRHQLSLLDRLGPRPLFRLKVTGTVKVSDKLKALALDPTVLIAEANVLHAGPEAKKNNVWAIGSESQAAGQWALQAIRLPDALTLATGAGIRVAVLDTGVDAGHPLLAGRLLPGWDFVDNDPDPAEAGSRADVAYGHGTHVSGLIAISAPAAQIMPLRVLDASGSGTAWALAAAMLHAVDPDGDPATDDGAHVINLSLGGPTRTRLLDNVALLASCMAPDPTVSSDDLSDSGYESDRVRCSGFGGAVVVAAAGNDGSRSVKEYPAAEGAYGLIAVAASGADGRLAPFSNNGTWVHIAAPGAGVTSSVPGAGWGTWSGTSMATPLVAGAAALMRSAAGTLSAADVVRCLSRNGRTLQDTALRQLDAMASLQAIGSHSLCR